jgi:hypothetical protein
MEMATKEAPRGFPTWRRWATGDSVFDGGECEERVDADGGEGEGGAEPGQEGAFYGVLSVHEQIDRSTTAAPWAAVETVGRSSHTQREMIPRNRPFVL